MAHGTIHFRPVAPSDLDKFPLWYERIGGPELFSNFIPSTFTSFDSSNDLYWFIVLNNDDEIGTIWFERYGTDPMSYDMGVYLNRIALFGKGIGRRVIQSAIDLILPKGKSKRLYLNVRQGNIRAIRCYRSLEFETIYEGEKNTDSGKIKYLRMKRPISD